MCNKIHEEHTVPKRERGKGWKIFNIQYGVIRTLICRSKYKTDGDRWVRWQEWYKDGAGFCFFFTRKEAEKALKAWSKVPYVYYCEIHQIYYDGVVCRQQEDRFVAGYSFDAGLCKAFKEVSK